MLLHPCRLIGPAPEEPKSLRYPTRHWISRVARKHSRPTRHHLNTNKPTSENAMDGQYVHCLGCRLLRLKLTDGKLSCTAAEFKPAPQLTEDLPAGTKVCCSDVPVKLGVLLLDPKCIQARSTPCITFSCRLLTPNSDWWGGVLHHRRENGLYNPA